MISNIKFNIFKKILRKIILVYYYFKFIINYDFDFYLKLQKKKYNELDLNRSIGINKLKDLKKEFNFLDYGMSSEHQILFCCLSEKKNLSIKKILEIGTFDGSNAVLLSKIFPHATIDTYDLSDNDEFFLKTYDRDNKKKRQQFFNSRNENLSKSPNINFYQKNSVNLILEKDKLYDLIWVDGNHGIPYVVVDVINSIRLLSKEGLIMCDDVYLKCKNDYSPYESSGTYQLLEILQQNHIVEYKLFYKRLSANYNAIPSERKFIGLAKIK